MEYDWFNYALSAAATYKLTKQFGFTGDFTYITQHPRIENFAPAVLPNTDKISVPLGRAGIYYNKRMVELDFIVLLYLKDQQQLYIELAA